MADGLSSNLIIKTRANKPEIGPLDEVSLKLKEILALQTSINNTPMKIKVNLSGSTEAISSLKNIIQMSAKAFRTLPKSERIILPKSGIGDPSSLPASDIRGAVGNRLSDRTVNKPGRKGARETTFETRDVSFSGNVERLVKTTNDKKGETIDVTDTNLSLSAERRRRAKEVSRDADLQARFEEERKELALRRKARERMERMAQLQGFTQRGETTTSTVRPVKGFDATMKTQAVEYYRVLRDGSEEVLKFDEKRDKVARTSNNRKTDAVKLQTKQTARLQSLETDFQRKTDIYNRRASEGARQVGELMQQGWRVVNQESNERFPVESLNRSVFTTQTRLARRIAAGRDAGADEVMTVDDSRRRGRQATATRVDRTTTDYQTRIAAEREVTRQTNRLARQRQSQADQAQQALAKAVDREARLATMTNRMITRGFDQWTDKTINREISPGVFRDQIDRTFRRQITRGDDQGAFQTQTFGGTGRGTSKKGMIDRNSDQYRNNRRNRSLAAEGQRMADEREKRLITMTADMMARGFTDFEDTIVNREISPGQFVNQVDRKFRQNSRITTGPQRGAQRIASFGGGGTGIGREGINKGTDEFKNERRAERVATNQAAVAGITGQGFALDKQVGDIQSYVKVLSDGSKEIIRFNEVTGRQSQYINQNTREFTQNARIQKIAANEARFAASNAALLANGYTEAARKVKTLSIGNQQVATSMVEMRKVTGNALFGNLQVEIQRTNTATGDLVKQTLTGKEAMRALGDSFSGAVSKITTWFAATSVIFLATNAMQKAAQQALELEANTILLARVGKGLGSTWTEQLSQAKLLTKEIVAMSTATGSDAVESQRAAAIFLRAGQDRTQTLESVRAAQLASKIAELDLVEAASLLSAAQVQFKLSATSLMPTLTSLNALSNTYKVTTNDLLQSISRAGSVYAESNGSLEQLAATTAVIGQVTNRTGAEIGNAIKTIQSRLTAPEVSGQIISKAGVSTVDSEGQTKNMTKLLLQLKIATQQMNAEDSKRLGVTIAGARQLNILQAALNQVTEIVIAEAKALRDTDSATDEYNATSGLLISSLQRTQAIFTQMVSAGEDGVSVFAALTDSLNFLLRISTAFDGLGIKIGLAVLAFIALRYALVKLNVEAITSAQVMGILQLNFLRSATGALTMGTAVRGLAAAMGPAGVIALALTAVLSYFIKLAHDSEQAVAKAATAEKDYADQLEKTTNRFVRRFRAVNSLTDAMNEYLRAIEAIEAKEKAGTATPEEKKFKQEAAGEVKRLTKEAGSFGPNGINPLDADGNLGPGGREAVLKEMEAARKKESDAAKKSIDEQIANQNKLLDAAKKAKDELGKQRVDIRDSESPSRQFNIPRVALENFKKKFPEGSQTAKDIDAAILKLAQDTSKATNEIDDLETKIKKLADSKKELDAGFKGNDIDLRQFTKMAEEAENLLTRFKKFDGKGGAFEIKFKQTGAKQATKEYEDLERAFNLGKSAFQGLFKQAANTEELKRLHGNLVEITEQLQKMKTAQAELAVSDARTYYKAQISDLETLSRAYQDNAAAQEVDRLSSGNTFIDADEEARKRINGLRNRAANLLTADLDMDAGGTDEERIARTTELQEAAADSLAEARKAEIERVVSQLKMETEITREKKKQREEAIKALGLLSDIEKAQVVNMAQEFKKNPGQKISASQQFMADEATNKLGQQFFGDQLESKIKPGEFLDRVFGGLSLGSTNEDLAKKEAAAKKFRDQQVDGVIPNKSDSLLDEEMRLRGIKRPGAADQNQIGMGLNQGARGANVEINHNFPIGEVIDRFEQISVVQMGALISSVNKRIDEMGKRLETVVGPLRDRIPTVDPN